MHFTTAELITMVTSFVWPFFRIAAMAGTMPIVSGRNVPARARLAFVVALTMVIAPTIPEVPQVDPISGEAILIVIQQVLIGAAMGFILQLVYNIFLVAAQVISLQMGLGFATMIDPQSGMNVPVVGQFFTILVTLTFLALNGHLALIEVVAESFHTIPIAATGIAIDGYWQIAAWGSQLFIGAMIIALPALSALLFVTVTFGVMARAAPQMNLFVLGIPISIILGYLIISFSLPVLIAQVEVMFVKGFGLIRQILGAG